MFRRKERLSPRENRKDLGRRKSESKGEHRPEEEQTASETKGAASGGKKPFSFSHYEKPISEAKPRKTSQGETKKITGQPTLRGL